MQETTEKHNPASEKRIKEVGCPPTDLGWFLQVAAGVSLPCLYYRKPLQSSRKWKFSFFGYLPFFRSVAPHFCCSTSIRLRASTASFRSSLSLALSVETSARTGMASLAGGPM